MSFKIRERTLYEYIGKVFGKYGCRYFTQVGVEGKEPDLIIEFDGSRVVSEVKIDSESKREEALVDACAKAFMLKTPHTMALLFPSYVRDIFPTELERMYPNLKVSATILTEWMTDRITEPITLENLAGLVTSHFQDWLRTKTPKVNYDLVVDIARGSIEEIAAYLRSHLVSQPILDSAMAVIGRFDIYKSLLEDVSGITENEAKLYIADITAYILANQLLFYHVLSEKLGYDRLPDVNPISPPDDLLSILDKLFEKVRSEYSRIFGLDLFPLLMQTQDLRIVYSTAKLVSKFKALRPQHIREDLFGRLYHETIPPETRKNLGAFYTKPEAAKLLATLAIDKWDAKVLDPACGSGTLLVESYHRKAQLAPPISKNELHKKFITEDIYGIDVMHFAAHMTTTNLTSQNIRVRVEPNVYSRDGVEAMVKPLQTESDPPTVEQTLDKWLTTMTGVGVPNDFDVVIMNPPFTRRERIPAEKDKLEDLVPLVKGKTGYWAYFVIGADKVLENNGILALVIPEEFFSGGGAESVRKYTFPNYGITHVVRSAVEVAFSESALYRDYLLILQKGEKNKQLVVTILKKKLSEIKNRISDIALNIKNFESSKENRITFDEFEAIKFANVDDLIKKHMSNLKPLVGFNTLNAQVFALELLDDLKDLPTIGELQESKLIKLRLYRPGQYRIKGVESYAEKLFTSKYGARSPNVTFIVDKVQDDTIRLRLKKKSKTFIDLPRKATVPCLRTYSGVKQMDITNEEEFAIIEPSAIPENIRNLSNLVPFEKVAKASLDIKKAHQELAGQVLLARRIQLSSSGAHWLAFYSDNEILGSQLPSIKVENENRGKLLTLYLNSVVTLLQLISFVAESRGAWVSLDHKRVWSHIHTPNITKLKDEQVEKVIRLFAKVSKFKAKTLLERLKTHDNLQREIDELVLEILGKDDWKAKLDRVYDAVADEIEAMHKILETSTGMKQAGRKK